MVEKTSEEKTTQRLYNFYNKISSLNLKAVDLIEMNFTEFKRALEIKKHFVKGTYEAYKRLLYELQDKEDKIVNFHKEKSIKILHHTVNEGEERGFREDFLERVSLVKEGETYYSAHYIGNDGSERHIFAPNLKRLKEILEELESSYNTQYKRQSLKIQKYTAFVDREIQQEVQSYLVP